MGARPNVARRHRFVGVAIVALAATTSLPVVPAAPARAASPFALTLVHQDLALAPDADLVVQFTPSAEIDPASIEVVVHQPILNRDSLRRAIDDKFGGSTDRMQVPPESVTIEGGVVQITVPTQTAETAESDAAALHIETDGVYPITVEATAADGGGTAHLISFVDRLPAADAPPEPAISVAVLAEVTAPPALPGATTPLPPDVLAAIDELGRYGPDVPISLDISPEIIGRLDAARLTALSKAMATGIVMSQPLFPLDPSAVTEARLEDSFRQRVLDGEDAIKASGTLPAPDVAVWYAPDGITDAGADLLREIGVRLLVVPSEVYLQAQGNTGPLTDYSQLYQSVLAPRSDDEPSDEPFDDLGQCAGASAACISTAVIDPGIAERLRDPDLSDEQAAIYTAADVVVYRDFFAASMQANVRRALILGTDGSGVVGATRMTRAVQMAAATGAATFITIDQFERSSGQAIADGRQLELRLPQPTPVDLTPRKQRLALLTLSADSVGSMLVADGGRSDRWRRTVDTLASTAITDEEVDAAADALEAEMQALRDCVVPPTKSTFTLAGRSVDLPLTLTNNCAESLRVSIHLEAAADKMQFPNNDTPASTIELPPGPTNFTVPVVARTNGTFDITLGVLTPSVSFPSPVFRAVTLKARINALTGLPQVITGAALLILLTWWARNQRRSRRARRIAAAVTHPSNT